MRNLAFKSEIADRSRRAEKQGGIKSHLFIYYIESYLNEPPGRLKVSTEEKYQHVQPNLAKKKNNTGKEIDGKRTHYAHLLSKVVNFQGTT